MLPGLIFLGFVLLVVGPIHWYVWRRLVKDTTRPGRWRVAGTIVIFTMVFALLAAFGVPRIFGAENSFAVSLVGYLWLALLFYLLVILLLVELPRLILLKMVSRRTPARLSGTRGPALAGAATGGTRGGMPSGAPLASSTAAEMGEAAPPVAPAVPGEAWIGSAHGSDGDSVARGGVAMLNAGSEPVDASGRADQATLQRHHDAAGPGALPGPLPATEDRQGVLTVERGETAPREAAGVGATPAGSADSATAGDEPANAGGDGERDASDGMSRRLLLSRGTAVFAGLTATGIVGYGVKTALGPPMLRRVRIPLARLPRNLDGYRIALVSDIHLGPLTDLGHSRRIVETINGMDADLVAIVGDLVDGGVAELGPQAAPLGRLRGKDGAYFVTGNHEYYSGVDEWLVELDRLGVTALRNERIEIRGLDVAGVDDVTGEQFNGGPDFDKALGDRDQSKPVVLLAHQPVVAKEAAKYNVDLQLSGHTHGGQMVPFNYVAALQQPVISGLGEVDGTKVYVTNGAGFWGPPVRVGAPPEITLVELRTG